MTFPAGLLFVSWQATVTLGSVLVGALIGLCTLAFLGYGARWKTNYETEKATSESLREGRDAFQAKAERLEGELAVCRDQLTKLEATRSLEPVLAAILDGFQEHEQRAQERHETNQRQGEQHLRILELIAERLGPENGNGH